MGGLLYLMTSCLGNDDEVIIDDWGLGNAQISTFLLSNDSITGLSKVLFTIDQLNSKIYNRDSMPYGTVIEEKVMCNVSFDSRYGIASIMFVQSLTNDTIWGTEDSINFSAPVNITVYPLDGISTKTYEAQINIHQVNPDIMIWQKYTDLFSGKKYNEMKVIPYHNSYYMYVSENGAFSLFKSAPDDIVNWEEVSLSGFPADAVLSQIMDFEGDLFIISKSGKLYCSVAGQNSSEGQSWSQFGDISLKAILGYLPENIITGRPAVLTGIVEEHDLLRFVSIGKNKSLNGGSEVPATFPLSGYSGLGYETMYHPRFVIASGRDSKNNLSDKFWSTMDGLSWALISNDRATFSPREGAALSIYDNCFFLVGGLDASGDALNDIYVSKDHGVTWSGDSMYVMPEEYPARGFSSVIVDKNNYMLLFGGKAGKNTNVLSDLWRGRINRLGFGKE